MFLSSLQVLRRRWYVTVAGVVLTAGLLVAAAVLVPASFITSAQMVLLPPHPTEVDARAAADSGVPTNPFLNLAGLEGMADVISRAMVDETTTKAMIAAGVSKTYTIEYDAASAAPVLVVTAEEPTPQKATSALAALLKQIPVTVTRLQADSSVAPISRVTVATISRPTNPERSGKSQLRALAVALVAGLSLTVVSASGLDAALTRRRRSRTNGGAGEPVPAADAVGLGEPPVPVSPVPVSPAPVPPRSAPPRSAPPPAPVPVAAATPAVTPEAATRVPVPAVAGKAKAKARTNSAKADGSENGHAATAADRWETPGPRLTKALLAVKGRQTESVEDPHATKAISIVDSRRASAAHPPTAHADHDGLRDEVTDETHDRSRS